MNGTNINRNKIKQSTLTSTIFLTAPPWEDNIMWHFSEMITPLLSKRADISLDDLELPWALK